MENSSEEWVLKAEEDWKIVSILLRAPDSPASGIMFHSQQTAEKYLKALLVKNFEEVQKTHDLIKLSNQCKRYEPSINILYEDLKFLDDYAVIPRYPGDYHDFTDEDIAQAVSSAKRLRFFFRKILQAKKKKRRK